MKVHEYQAKAILSQFGIPVPDGGVASTSQEVNNIMEKLGGSGVIKAQIHAGGRGMAGGVKVVGSAEEAETTAEKLLGTKLVTHQTGPEGASVDNVVELNQNDKDRIFNLGYYTWVEQQGIDLHDFEKRKEQSFWNDHLNHILSLDKKVEEFNSI